MFTLTKYYIEITKVNEELETNETQSFKLLNCHNTNIFLTITMFSTCSRLKWNISERWVLAFSNTVVHIRPFMMTLQYWLRYFFGLGFFVFWEKIYVFGNKSKYLQLLITYPQLLLPSLPVRLLKIYRC